MFSVQQKRDIADKVQQILRDTKHPELPEGEIAFLLHIEGAESWSWADIRNNGSITSPGVNPWNEKQSRVRGQVPTGAPQMRKVRNPEALCGCGHRRNEHAGVMQTGLCRHTDNPSGSRMWGDCKCPYFKGSEVKSKG